MGPLVASSNHLLNFYSKSPPLQSRSPFLGFRCSLGANRSDTMDIMEGLNPVI